MKRISLLVLIAALVSFAAVSCKKYEDGPTFSLASKKGRVAGDWTVEKATYTSGGSTVDVTEDLKSEVEKWSFTKDGDFTISGDGMSETGTWEFDDDKENIIITIDGDTWTWEIKRLKSKELWVKWTDNDLEIQFEQ